MTVAFIDSVHPVLAQRLSAAGHGCMDLSQVAPAELPASLANADGIVVRGRIMLDAPLLDGCPRVRFIARAGSGLENIDQAYCTQRGIAVINSPEGNCNAVAEHALALLLNLMRHVRRADTQVRAGQWLRKENSGQELSGRTVGLIGFGHTGKAFARKLAGFEVELLVHDTDPGATQGTAARAVDLNDLLAYSDVVSLHLPLKADTLFYADERFFGKLQRPVRFLNTARGPLTRTRALLDALDDGRVRAAGLDVLEQEERSLLGLSAGNDPVLQRLYAHPDVLLTPHIAGVTEESYFRMADVLADKILHRFADA